MDSMQSDEIVYNFREFRLRIDIYFIFFVSYKILRCRSRRVYTYVHTKQRTQTNLNKLVCTHTQTHFTARECSCMAFFGYVYICVYVHCRTYTHTHIYKPPPHYPRVPAFTSDPGHSSTAAGCWSASEGGDHGDGRTRYSTHECTVHTRFDDRGGWFARHFIFRHHRQYPYYIVRDHTRTHKTVPDNI